jgi:hypothetical protein
MIGLKVFKAINPHLMKIRLATIFKIHKKIIPPSSISMVLILPSGVSTGKLVQEPTVKMTKRF